MVTRTQNPFLFGQIPTDLSLVLPQGTPQVPPPGPAQAPASGPAGGQAPQPAPAAAPQPDPDFEGRRQRWTQFLKDPRVQAGMMQFGMSLMAGSSLGGAINQGMGATGRAASMQQEQQQAAQQQQRERELQDREFGLDQRRTTAYEQSVQQQGLGSAGTPGDVTERERFDRQQEQAFESTIRQRAQDEYEAALEAFQQQQLFNPDDPTAWGPEPDFNQFYYKVATEEVLRSRGLLPVVLQMPPEQQQKIFQIAAARGVATAVAVVEQLTKARGQSAPAQQTPPQTVQTGT